MSAVVNSATLQKIVDDLGDMSTLSRTTVLAIMDSDDFLRVKNTPGEFATFSASGFSSWIFYNSPQKGLFWFRSDGDSFVCQREAPFSPLTLTTKDNSHSSQVDW